MQRFPKPQIAGSNPVGAMTKTCQLCGREFPARMEIGGKVRPLYRRRYCPTCSPYGGKNRRQLNRLATPGVKRCPRCGGKKAVDEFYRRRSGSQRSGFSPYCKVCTNLQTIEPTQKTKRQAVAFMGGACMVCGYSRCFGALEFHHVDRTAKAFAIGGKKTKGLEALKPELRKCVLLCSNCHKEAEAGLINLAALLAGRLKAL